MCTAFWSTNWAALLWSLHLILPTLAYSLIRQMYTLYWTQPL